MKLLGLTSLFVVQATPVAGFVLPKTHRQLSTFAEDGAVHRPTTLIQVSSSSGETSKGASVPATKKKTLKELRAEGGFSTFNTPIGALNLFAIYYGLMSIFLGIPWFVALKACQFMYWITGGRFDKKVR